MCCLGYCLRGGCFLDYKCGNGVVQGEEECECASGTSCRFCTNCKLDEGKACTPDTVGGCCNDDGSFDTTSSSCKQTRSKGCCNGGVCSTQECGLRMRSRGGIIVFDTFCGASWYCINEWCWGCLMAVGSIRNVMYLSRNSFFISDFRLTHAEVTTTTTKAKPGNHHAPYNFALSSRANRLHSVLRSVQWPSCYMDRQMRVVGLVWRMFAVLRCVMIFEWISS